LPVVTGAVATGLPVVEGIVGGSDTTADLPVVTGVVATGLPVVEESAGGVP